MSGFAAPGIAELIVLLFMIAIMALFTLLPLWMICAKAGFPGWISLAAVIPVFAVILLFYLAFAEWPALRKTYGDDRT
jgi:uncharacterized membrane protein YhaH (DUF805 family)